jgi:hypothetical protein
MILKGNQRGSGQKLATQLLNADNNQRIDMGVATLLIASQLETTGKRLQKLEGKKQDSA